MTAHLDHDWYPEPLPPGVRIGARSWLYSSFAFVHMRSGVEVPVSIGHDSGVYAGTFFDLGPSGAVAIGDFSTVVGAIFATNGRVTIGDYCFVAHEVVIADSPFARPGPEEGPADAAIEIGDDVWIGAGVVLLGGARLGRGSVIGAGTVVDFAVPPLAVVAGSPARVRSRIASAEIDR